MRKRGKALLHSLIQVLVQPTPVCVTLEEVKLFHWCVADRYEADEQEGRVARSTQLLLGKLSSLIVSTQLTSFHWPTFQLKSGILLS